jgi:SPW repeat
MDHRPDRSRTDERDRLGVDTEVNSAYPDTRYGRPGSPVAAQTAAGLTFLVGLWLVVAPWTLSYDWAISIADAEIAVGTAVAVSALVQLTVPLRFPRLWWLAFALGAWTICAPFVLGSGPGFDGAALWNEIVSGALLLALGAKGVAAAELPRSDRRRPSSGRR